MRATCPACGKQYVVPDTLADKPLKCKNCEEVFSAVADAPPAKKTRPAPRDDDNERVQSKSRPAAASRKSSTRDEDDDEEDFDDDARPRRRRPERTRKNAGSLGLIMAGIS